MQVQYTPQYDQNKISSLTIDVRERGIADSTRRAGRFSRSTTSMTTDERMVAAIVGDREIVLWRKGETGDAVQATVSVANNHRVRQVRVGRRGSITAGTDDGRLYHWVLEEQPRLTDVVTVAEEPITALEYLIGGTSLVVGTQGGGLSSWFPAAGADGAEHDGPRPRVRGRRARPSWRLPRRRAIEVLRRWERTDRSSSGIRRPNGRSPAESWTGRSPGW